MVSVIGDSTFVHSGITGLVEMVYNPPPTGHVVLILDNGTTAMTGLQEHPAPAARSTTQPTGKLVHRGPRPRAGHRQRPRDRPASPTRPAFETLADASAWRADELAVIVARRRCLLAAGKIKRNTSSRTQSPPTRAR